MPETNQWDKTSRLMFAIDEQIKLVGKTPHFFPLDAVQIPVGRIHSADIIQTKRDKPLNIFKPYACQELRGFRTGKADPDRSWKTTGNHNPLLIKSVPGFDPKPRGTLVTRIDLHLEPGNHFLFPGGCKVRHADGKGVVILRRGGMPGLPGGAFIRKVRVRAYLQP